MNLERFLRGLPLPLSISIGEPKRNKDYRQAIRPKRKSDPSESYAMGRYAVAEQPPPTPDVPESFQLLREVASRLHSQVRQTTRWMNQLHDTLARVFPELAVQQQKLAARWVLTLLSTYPTSDQIAAAPLDELKKIRYLKAEKASAIQEAARQSVGSLKGEVAEEIVRGLVRQVESSQREEARLKKLLRRAYDALPAGPHRQVETIPGIGKVTAAILVAKIVDIDRFETPNQLVSYFGVFPEEVSSGVDRRGKPIPPGTRKMSPKGNDLVRGYLWMVGKAAVQFNPAVRALFRRLRARGKNGFIAYGACMRKLLGLVFAVWKSDRPFDPQHYPWENPPPQAAAPTSGEAPGDEHKVAAGHKPDLLPERNVVTAAHSTVEPPTAPVKRSVGSIDYAWLRGQISMEQVLRELGIWHTLRGSAQRRGPCPLHTGAAPHSRSFSVDLAKGIFQCFHASCATQGNVLDLWAAVRHLPLYEAALNLAETFRLPLTPTEKRNP